MVNMYQINENLRTKQSDNDRTKTKYYYIENEANKELVRLLKEIKKAKAQFYFDKMPYGQERPSNTGVIVMLNESYSKWFSAVEMAASFAANQIEYSKLEEGSYKFAGQKLSEDLIDALQAELDELSNYKGFGSSPSRVSNLNKQYEKYSRQIPISRMSQDDKQSRNIDNVYNAQLKLVSNYFDYERQNKSSNGDYSNPEPQKRDEKADKEFKQQFTRDFSKMFGDLIHSMQMFHAKVFYITENNSSSHLESLKMEDVEDLKMLVDNIELFKSYLDENVQKEVEEIFSKYLQAFNEDYEKLQQKLSEMQPTNI